MNQENWLMWMPLKLIDAGDLFTHLGRREHLGLYIDGLSERSTLCHPSKLAYLYRPFGRLGWENTRDCMEARPGWVSPCQLCDVHPTTRAVPSKRPFLSG